MIEILKSIKCWTYYSELEIVSNVFGAGLPIFSLFFSFIAALKSIQVLKENKKLLKKNNDQISIVLKKNNGNKEDKIVLQYKPKRVDLTRAEILGLLGMQPLKKPRALKKILSRRAFIHGKDQISKDHGANGANRFKPIRYMSTSEFMQNLDSVRDDEELKTLVINCTDDEYEQFDKERIR